MKLCELPVLIMCGGKGSRFHQFEEQVQKCSAPIGETSIIKEVITSLSDFGFRNLHFLVGKGSQHLINHVRGFLDNAESEQFLFDRHLQGTAIGVQSVSGRLPDKFLYHHGNFLVPSGAYTTLETACGSDCSSTHFNIPGETSITHPRIEATSGRIVNAYDKKDVRYSKALPPLAGIGIVDKSSLVTPSTTGLALECCIDFDRFEVKTVDLESPWEHIESERDRRILEEKWLNQKSIWCS